MKVQWWFCTTAPNSNCERSSTPKKLAFSLCCSDLHFVAFCCFAHLNCCWLAVFRYGWGTKGKSVLFLIFLLLLLLRINVHLLWTPRSLCQYEESSGSRTYLGWAKYTPWRNCWETMESMDWLLLSKSVNVCVFVHVCYSTSIVKKTFLTPLSCRPYMRSCDLPRLRAGPKYSSSQERAL